MNNSVETSKLLYVVPSQGNEPYKLGVDIALEVGKFIQAINRPKPIVVVPSIYGRRQEQILKEEFPDNVSDIFLDDKAGEIISPLLFGKAGYNAHLNALVHHYSGVNEKIRHYFERDNKINIRSLATNEYINLPVGNILASIDTGGKIQLPIDHRYFCFPTLFSELLNETVRVQETGEYAFGFSVSEMKQVKSRMEKMEDSYSMRFIPQMSTLSYLKDYPYQGLITEYNGRTLTPPLVRNRQNTDGMIDKDGVYVMFSGTEVDQEANNLLFETVWGEGLEIYVPPWVNLESSYMHEGSDFFKAPPAAIGDKRILAVAGRAGWGTGWQTQHFAKPWYVHKYYPDDDPEMYFNSKTVEYFHMGEILDPDANKVSSFDGYWNLRRRFQSYSLITKAYLDQYQRPVFPPTNGIEYVGVKITNDLAAKGVFGSF